MHGEHIIMRTISDQENLYCILTSFSCYSNKNVCLYAWVTRPMPRGAFATTPYNSYQTNMLMSGGSCKYIVLRKILMSS